MDTATLEQLILDGEWQKLGLPNPEQLLSTLKNGIDCEIGGHKLTTDDDGIWITNPYAIDCGFWQDVDLKKIEQFLADMARGVEYGPVP